MSQDFTGFGNDFGLLSLQVDDTVFTGTREFLYKEDTTCSAEAGKFPAKDYQVVSHVPIEFNGSFFSEVDSTFVMQQSKYINGIDYDSHSFTSEDFAYLRGKIAYATNQTAPQFTCRLNMLAQITVDQVEKSDHKHLRKLLADMKADCTGLTYQRLDMSSAAIRVYTDASFAQNRDLSSQLGWCVYLVDKNGQCNLIHWCSRKCRRVVKSAFAAELFALIQGHDYGIALQHSLKNILGRDIELSIYIDSKSVWDSVISLKPLTEKRLLIDIACLRESYQNGELRSFACIDTKFNPADAFTKVIPGPYFAESLKAGCLVNQVEVTLAHGPLPVS